MSYSRCNEMLFRDNKDCEEDVFRLTGTLSREDLDLRYLVIWLPMTAQRLNPLLFPKLALTLSVEKRSKPLQLAVVCARAEARCGRDGGQSTLLCHGCLYQEDPDAPPHCQFLDFCSTLSSASREP